MGWSVIAKRHLVGISGEDESADTKGFASEC